MVSSKLDDLQDQDDLGLFAKITQHVALAKSHMLSISHSTAKPADSRSSISEVTLTSTFSTCGLIMGTYSAVIISHGNLKFS
jgi:hypothetical protein